jgi:DNA adenine methylase
MAFCYIGGKAKIGRWIKDYIPTDIKIYAEPFGGAFWVFYRLEHEKFNNLNTIVYNDSNILNTNLNLCIRKYSDFHKYICNIPAQEKDRFNEYQKHVFNTPITIDECPNFQFGLEYVYTVTQVFSGKKPETYAIVSTKGKKSKFDSFKDKLVNPKWTCLFDKVTNYENLDFSEIINKYDSKDSFFYVDPPYKNLEWNYSKHDFKGNEHDRLAKMLNEIKGRFALSYYYFDGIEDLYPKNKFNWIKKEFNKEAGWKKNVIVKKGIELLIMNY